MPSQSSPPKSKGFSVKHTALTLALSCLCAISTTAQTRVTVEPLSGLATYPDRFAPATVISLNEPLLSAQITAQIAEVPVRVGDKVAAGDVLARLECDEYRFGRESAEANLESTESRYQLAQKNLERTQSLITNQLVSIENLDSANTELEALAASLKAAKASLNINRLYEARCEIRAPFDALVLERLASVGQLAVPGTPIARIMDLAALEISAQIFSSDAAYLDTQTELEFESNGDSYPVRLNHLVEALNSVTRNREARLQFIDRAALPGASGKIHWTDPRPHLPPDYTVERNGELGFFILRNRQAEFKALESAQQGRSNPVDLPLDSLIIVEGFAGLSDGQAVQTSE